MAIYLASAAMMVVCLVFAVALLAFSAPLVAAESPYKTYEGYKIYDVWAQSEEQAQVLRKFYEKNLNMLDFLIISRTVGRPMRFLTNPQQEVAVQAFLKEHELNYGIVNSNLTASVEAQSLSKKKSALLQRIRQGSVDNFESYLRYADIDAYLEYLAKEYPQRVSMLTVGRSYEGRELKALLISNGSDVERQEKPLILIDAAIHAREWIAPEAALYVIQQLVENATYNAAMLQAYDWLIWPLVNADGYEYTHEQERFWRKTRKPSGVTTNCLGTDANRNFDFHWGEAGTSANPCAETYKGPIAFSEPEAVALRELLFRVNSTCRMYLTLHSYGNYLLYPWGYDDILPPTWKYLDAVARAGADAIEAATGTIYEVGSSTNVLYAAAGASDDYAFGVANIPVSITMELPSGGSGFDPPPSQIRPIVEETWVGISAMAAKLLELGNFETEEGAGNNAANNLSGNIFWNLLF